jgi:hypothetical protein
MAGIGFMLFIAPPLAGVSAGLLLLFADRLRFLAAYAFCAPLCGAIGGWYGLDVFVGSQVSSDYILGISHSWLSAHGFLLALLVGYCLGIGLGAIAGLGINRLARLVVT